MRRILRQAGLSLASAACFTLCLCISTSVLAYDEAVPRGPRQDNGPPPPDCDPKVPALVQGYGSTGQYHVDVQTVQNPEYSNKPVFIFFPRELTDKRPVIFFSHGFGPGYWESYKDLLGHMVSEGYVVVFSSYPEQFATNDKRYDSLWAGFAAAAKAYPDRMDLTRVAFVGHSFGAGATPMMAYKGIVQQGWGSNGAFLLELAPWYSYQITDADLQQLPPKTVQMLEVYDKDSVNDQRMAMDLYNATHVDTRYYFLVHSVTVSGCEFTAQHDAPGRGTSLELKRYAVFRPFDALADWVFNGNLSAKGALDTMGNAADAAAFKPLELEIKPAPVQPSSYYMWPWDGGRNPRAH